MERAASHARKAQLLLSLGVKYSTLPGEISGTVTAQCSVTSSALFLCQDNVIIIQDLTFLLLMTGRYRWTRGYRL